MAQDAPGVVLIALDVNPLERAMHHTIRYDARAGRVEIYRHDQDQFDGEPVILIDEQLDKFGRSPESAEQMAAWLGRILLVDNPAVRKALGLR